MRLLLIRHGESTSNADGRVQGRLDSPLSARGRRESERLAERLGEFAVDALYSSTLSRARDTAKIVSGRLGLPIVERPALMERDVGELEGLTREEVRARYPEFVRAREEGRREVTVVGWEPREDFAGRVRSAVEELIEGHPGQTVAVVSHGGVIGQFCRFVLGLPPERPWPFALANASISAVEVQDGDSERGGRPRLQIVTLNDTCHLNGL